MVGLIVRAFNSLDMKTEADRVDALQRQITTLSVPSKMPLNVHKKDFSREVRNRAQKIFHLVYGVNPYGKKWLLPFLCEDHYTEWEKFSEGESWKQTMIALLKPFRQAEQQRLASLANAQQSLQKLYKQALDQLWSEGIAYSYDGILHSPNFATGQWDQERYEDKLIWFFKPSQPAIGSRKFQKWIAGILGGKPVRIFFSGVQETLEIKAHNNTLVRFVSEVLPAQISACRIGTQGASLVFLPFADGEYKEVCGSHILLVLRNQPAIKTRFKNNLPEGTILLDCEKYLYYSQQAEGIVALLPVGSEVAISRTQRGDTTMQYIFVYSPSDIREEDQATRTLRLAKKQEIKWL